MTTRLWFWAFVFVAALAIIGVTQRESRAADCCKVTYSADHETATVTGYLEYRGELVSVLFNGDRCLSRAGDGRAYMKGEVPTKFLPNGEYKIDIVQRVDGDLVFTKQLFRVTNSPAVTVEVTAPKSKIVKTDAPTIGFKPHGAVTDTACTLDGNSIGCGSSSAQLSGLSEGKHVFVVKVEGKLSFTDTARKEFKVDTQPPSAPIVTGGGEAWQADSVTLRASGSTDAGSGIDHYEFQISTDSGETWGGTGRGNQFTVHDQGETLVRFRAVDRIGTASEWTVGMARIDNSLSEVAIVQSNGTTPCDVTFPLTLSASGGTNVDHYEWTFSRQGYADEHSTGPSITFTEAGTYYASVTSMEPGGELGSIAYWNNASC